MRWSCAYGTPAHSQNLRVALVTPALVDQRTLVRRVRLACDKRGQRVSFGVCSAWHTRSGRALVTPAHSLRLATLSKCNTSIKLPIYIPLLF